MMFGLRMYFCTPVGKYFGHFGTTGDVVYVFENLPRTECISQMVRRVTQRFEMNALKVQMTKKIPSGKFLHRVYSIKRTGILLNFCRVNVTKYPCGRLVSVGISVRLLYELRFRGDASKHYHRNSLLRITICLKVRASFTEEKRPVHGVEN